MSKALRIFSIVSPLIPASYGVYSLFSQNHKWTPFSKEYEHSKEKISITEDSIGVKYGNYLLGTGEENKSWWIRNYKKLMKDWEPEDQTLTGLLKLDDSGKSVDRAFDKNTSSLALNMVCLYGYMIKAEDMQKQTKGDSDNFKEDNLWKYCSVLMGKPITVEKDNSATTKTGKIGDSKKSELISTTTPSNNLFWKIRNDEFYEKNGFHLKKNTENYKYFENKKSTKLDIRRLCEDAYSMESSQQSTITSPSEKEVLKYCSLI